MRAYCKLLQDIGNSQIIMSRASHARTCSESIRIPILEILQVQQACQFPPQLCRPSRTVTGNSHVIKQQHYVNR